MLLDAGVLDTRITEEDFGDQVFTPYVEEHLEDFENTVDEDLEDANNYEASVNFNDDVSKIAISDILNEMRMGSPIQNDLFNDLFSDEANNNFENRDHEGSTVNPNNCDSNNFDFNDVPKEQNTEDIISTDHNPLDLLQSTESCSTPDVQMEINDEVLFQFDASEQLSYGPDMSFSYFNDPDNAIGTSQEKYEPIFQDNFEQNFEVNNQANCELETYFSNTVPVNNNQYFECSTNLPMTPEELQDDIQKYLNSQQNYNYASFYEYADTPVLDGKNCKQDNNGFDFLYKSDVLPEYISEQNRLFQSLDSVNPIDSFEPPNVAPPEQFETFQCNICSFYTQSLREFIVHMRVHSDTHLNCTECKFTTKKPFYLRQHQGNGTNTAYCCRTCDYVTHSSSKIRSHMRREH